LELSTHDVLMGRVPARTALQRVGLDQARLDAVLQATGQHFAEVEAERAVEIPRLVEAAPGLGGLTWG